MRIRVLGSIEADDGESISIGGPTQRRILAMLALHAGDIVSLDRLVEATWPDGDAPAQADRNVRTYVHRLRLAFGGELEDRIETIAPGYRLNISPAEVDAARFDELASTATRLSETGDAVAALDTIAKANELWRGRPFGEFADEEWARPEVERLVELHVSLQEIRAEMLLESGQVASAIGEAEKLATGFPFRERPRSILMRALYNAGRQAEALRAFQDYRGVLADDVGLDPSDDLTALDRSISSGDEALRRAGPAPRTVGAYELHERIGEGAFAMVYRATQPALGRDVAVKAIRAELANRPEFIRRFEAEAHMVAKLEHPHIVPLYDYWREPDSAYLVMRWLPGGTLERALDDGPWTLDRTIAMVEQVGSALAVAHRAGVVHRDVKPANIIFDEDGNAFLADFGIALEAEDLARPESALSEGSPAYAAPEQLKKLPVGPSADVHGLAIAVYEALTAELPFGDSPDAATALTRQLNDAIPRLSDQLPLVPEAVDEVLQRATAKDPTQRYQNVMDFVEALSSAAVGPEPSEFARRADQVRTAGTVLGGAVENPYKGLRAFDETDAGEFFGRERLIDELLGRMGPDVLDGNLLAVVGPSGSGKSSVVRAGLVPALRRGAIAGSADWFVTTMNPGTHPYEQLETALLRVAVNPPTSLLEQLSAGPRGILRSVRRVLPDDTNPLLVVIDQFEELFTLCDDESVRTKFLAGLAVAVSEPNSPVRIVLTLRADFYDRPLRYPEFAALVKQNSVTVTPLAGDELEHAIVDPAARVGVEFEGGLVAQIVADVASQPGALPLLQYALTELFDTHVSGLLLLDRYRDMGGLNGALARRAEELHQAASEGEQSAIRRLFGRLITLGEGIEDTRRRVAHSEVAIDQADVSVIDLYGEARLLTFDHDPVTREGTVEVAHEAVIREWPRLREWLDEDRQGIRLLRHLTISSAGWADRGRDGGELYRGVRLDAAEIWTATVGPRLSPLEEEFLRVSGERRDEEADAERNRVRRLRRLLVTTGAVAIVALLAGALAFRQQQRADDQAALAESNAALANDNAEQAAANATQANANAEEAAANAELANESARLAASNAELADVRAEEAEAAQVAGDLDRMGAVALAAATESPQVAALLAVETHRLAPSVESLDLLHRVLTAVPGFRGAVPGASYLAAHLHHDGETMVVVSRSAIDVWNLRTRELIRSIPHANPVDTARFDVTSDGRTAAVRSATDETLVYDLTTGDLLASLKHGALINDVSISADDSRLAVARSDGGVEIWDMSSFTRERTLDSGEVSVSFARWSPTEDRLAVVTLRSEVQFWDPAEAERIWTVPSPGANLVNETTPFAFLFSSDGERLVFVSGSLSPQLRTVVTSDGSQPFGPTVVTDAGGFLVDSLYWIDEDAMVLGVPNTGGIQSFDLLTKSALPPIVESFVEPVDDAVFSTELGLFVAVGGRGLEFWSADDSGPLERVALLSDDQREALASNSGSVHTSLSQDSSQLLVSTFAIPAFPATMSFDLTTEPPTPSVFDPAATVTIGFGPYTLAAGFMGVQLLDPSLQPLGDLIALPFDFTELSASPDGRYFAFGRLGGLMDLHTGSGEFVATLSIGDEAEFVGAQVGPSFTSDGAFVMAGTTDGSFAVWSTETLEKIDVGEWRWGTLMGEWLFAGLEDGSFQRVDLAEAQLVGVPMLDPPGSGLGYGKLDETNSRVAATGADTVKVWDLASGQQLGRELPYFGIRIEFSEDGKLLTVPGNDRVTLWNYDTDTWADIACEMAGRNLTESEWTQLGPRTIDYRATCPQFPLP